MLPPNDNLIAVNNNNINNNNDTYAHVFYVLLPKWLCWIFKPFVMDFFLKQ